MLTVGSCEGVFAHAITVCLDNTVSVARNQIAVLALGASVVVGGEGALEAVGAVAVEDALACKTADARVANAGAGFFVDCRAQSVAERVRITGFARFEAVVNIVLESVVWAGRARSGGGLGVGADGGAGWADRLRVGAGFEAVVVLVFVGVVWAGQARSGGGLGVVVAADKSASGAVLERLACAGG